MEFFDSYSRRARLYPAILGAAPAFALATIAVPWNQLGAPQVIVALGVGVLLFSFADIARRFGLRAERRMFASTGGRPFPTVFRHRDATLDTKSKDRYLKFLGQRLEEKAPSQVDEEFNPAAADAFYVRCGNWLRPRTRDKAKFRLLFEENVTYGFRRNLYGLKMFCIFLNFAVIFACFLFFGLAREEHSLWLLFGVFVFAILHALYFLFAVTKKSVLDASNQYGRELALSCEVLMDDKPHNA
ncbi:hypothetical protein [Mesorhizobium sp.]|uniref:hypothetical protein n=1 Tax=Mesorhizobium sp. TaxID=1871066 RepID=UPI000FEA0EC3|nr:hypothetical protein [Mesorhizobium sp.]RWO89568.1 MAG: hypothetical protein EOQ96_05250 [Mesorhizobium sp.]